MPTQDPIADQLTVLYEHTTRPSRQQRILQRWTRYPALTGRTLDDIAAALADPDHPNHNRVGADLLRANRDGDRDATTIILHAVRPAVIALSRPIPPHPRPVDNRAHLWAAVGKLIATTNPDIVAANPRPFMLTLIGHIRRDRARYSALHTHGYVPAGDTDTEISDHLDATTAGTDTTAQAALASLCLQQISTHVRSSRHGHARWQELLQHSLPATATTLVVERERVRRLRRELVHLTRAHAA